MLMNLSYIKAQVRPSINIKFIIVFFQSISILLKCPSNSEPSKQIVAAPTCIGIN